MSDNVTPENILAVKRKLIQAENEASDFEFGFDVPSKKSNSSKKSATAISVPLTKHRIEVKRRASTFIETNNFDSTENRSESPSFETQNQQKNKQSSHAKGVTKSNVNPNVLRDSNQRSLEFDISDDIENFDFIEFSLDPSESDDLTLIELSNRDESLLFRNNYFQTMESSETSHRAICLICGFDENNKPKKVISGQPNVSSNFITHLKVMVSIIVTVFLVIFSYVFVHLCFRENIRTLLKNTLSKKVSPNKVQTNHIHKIGVLINKSSTRLSLSTL